MWCIALNAKCQTKKKRLESFWHFQATVTMRWSARTWSRRLVTTPPSWWRRYSQWLTLWPRPWRWGLVNQNLCTETSVKVCEDKPVEVVRVSCEDVTTEKCVIVPEVEEAEEEVRHCQPVLCTVSVQSFRSRCAGPRSPPRSATPWVSSCPRSTALRLYTDTPTASGRGCDGIRGRRWSLTPWSWVAKSIPFRD